MSKLDVLACQPDLLRSQMKLKQSTYEDALLLESDLVGDMFVLTQEILTLELEMRRLLATRASITHLIADVEDAAHYYNDPDPDEESDD